MLQAIVTELGPWSWWVVGLLLLGAELIMPGVFLVWIGLGAIVTGTISLAVWGAPYWGWQIQLLVFAALAIVATLLGRRFLSGSRDETDEPLLNQRGASLVGRTATLKDPITEGRGRIHLDGTYWPVTGPDLPSGSRVKIVSSHGGDLTVDAA